jgi:cation diffusion facilitator family transporter
VYRRERSCYVPLSMSHRRPALTRALWLNTAALVVELTAGVASNSISLIVDGVHNVSDEVALGLLVLAYTLRAGLSGRFLRMANLFNSVGLFSISALVVWQAIERVARPQPIHALVPIVAGLVAAAANAAVAYTLRDASRHDAAVRLAYAHNLGDTVVSLAPAAAGGLTLLTGNSVFDPLVALGIAAAVIVPSVRTLVTSHRELMWPEDVACGPHSG